MIKINLLGVAPPPTKAPSVGAGPPAPKATQLVMFVGALIISFGIVFIVYEVWTNEIADLQKRQSRERQRKTELAVVKGQNEQYQQRLRDLETRINTIQALQNGRVGPVELMAALGSIINESDDIYLYTMAPSGDRVQLKGQSGTVDSMANFMASLKDSGSFADVQLQQFYQDDYKDHLAYKFTLDCEFKSPTGGASPMAGGAPESPGGPAKPAAAPSGGPESPPAAPPQGLPTRRAF
jgi:Tfp pilus assembly protein PilN